MPIETWKAFAVLTALVIAYGLLVGVVGVPTSGFIAFVLATAVGLYVGWRLSKR